MDGLTVTVFARYGFALDVKSRFSQVIYSAPQPQDAVFMDGLQAGNAAEISQMSEYPFFLRHGHAS